MQNDTQEIQSDDFRAVLAQHWHTLPQELRDVIQKDEHITVVRDATKNMLFSRKTIDEIELAAISTMLGVLPYRMFEDVLKNQSITDRDRTRATTYLQEHLFTPHKEALDTLAVNKTLEKKQVVKTPEVQEAPVEQTKTATEKAIIADAVLYKKFSKLPKKVQESITSGPTEYALNTILTTYAKDDSKKTQLQQHILMVLVGTGTMSQFKELVQHGELVAESNTKTFLLDCETKLFGPVRKVILQSLEQTG